MPLNAPISQQDKAARPAWVSRLRLVNFRIHQKLDLSLSSPAPIVLTGPNGSGKTSLLEAMSLLGPGRGLRLARNEEFMRRHKDQSGEENSSGWSVAGKIFYRSAEYHIGTGCAINAEGRARHRQVRMNGRSVSAAHLARYIRLFWLTPAMARLFGENSDRAARRRLIDRITIGLFPDHADHLISFDRVRKARQSILFENRRRRADEWLSALEAQMAAHGCALAQARHKTAQQLNHHMHRLKPEIFPAGQLRMEGEFEKNLCEASAYRDELARSRAADAAAGRTKLGPHHADVILTHLSSGQSARHCSSGEVKALLTALILASAQLAGESSSATAIILLDDIAAHLDQARRNGLFDTLADFPAQIWMTGTDRDIFAPLKMNAHFFTITPGSAYPG